jgi:hypothetical protein
MQVLKSSNGARMSVDLFIKKIPDVVKELISREAVDNRRSINQEAIALLEEALLQRAGAHIANRRNFSQLLEEQAAHARRDGVGAHAGILGNFSHAP